MALSLAQHGEGFLAAAAQDTPGARSPIPATARSVLPGDVHGKIHLYDRATGKLLADWQAHPRYINRLCFLDGDSKLLSIVEAMESNPPRSVAEFVLWNLPDKKVLRRRDYSHDNLPHGGYPSVRRLAAAGPTLFVVDRTAVPVRLRRLDLNTGAEKVLLENDDINLVTSGPQPDKLAARSLVQRKRRHALGRHFLEIVESGVDAAAFLPPLRRHRARRNNVS